MATPKTIPIIVGDLHIVSLTVDTESLQQAFGPLDLKSCFDVNLVFCGQVSLNSLPKYVWFLMETGPLGRCLEYISLQSSRFLVHVQESCASDSVFLAEHGVDISLTEPLEIVFCLEGPEFTG